MTRRILLALALPAILLAGCDSLSRFARGRASLGDNQPAPESLAAETPTAEAPPAELPTAEAPTAEAKTVGATARLSDREPPATAAAQTVTSAAAGAGEASPKPPAAAPAPEVQLAAASSVTGAARRAFDAVVASLPNPAASQDEKLARQIAAFEPFPFGFDLPSLDGSSLSSRETRSQLVVVDVWATWCGPCRKAIPDFVALQKAYASRGVQVVGITCDSADPSEAAEVRRKATEIGERLQVNYPLLIDDGSTTEQIPGFRGYPTTLFLTPDGQVLYKVTGMQSEAQLAAIVDHLLASP